MKSCTSHTDAILQAVTSAPRGLTRQGLAEGLGLKIQSVCPIVLRMIRKGELCYRYVPNSRRPIVRRAKDSGKPRTVLFATNNHETSQS